MAKKNAEGIYSPAKDRWPEQLVKTYHMGFGSSPTQRFEKDCAELAQDEWRLVHAAVGQDGTALGGVVIAIYQR